MVDNLKEYSSYAITNPILLCVEIHRSVNCCGSSIMEDYELISTQGRHPGWLSHVQDVRCRVWYRLRFSSS